MGHANSKFGLQFADSVTIGGQATYEEMCLAYTAYYPRTPRMVGYCISAEVPGSNRLLHMPLCDMADPNDFRPEIVYQPVPQVGSFQFSSSRLFAGRSV